MDLPAGLLNHAHDQSRVCVHVYTLYAVMFMTLHKGHHV